MAIAHNHMACVPMHSHFTKRMERPLVHIPLILNKGQTSTACNEWDVVTAGV